MGTFCYDFVKESIVIDNILWAAKDNLELDKLLQKDASLKVVGAVLSLAVFFGSGYFVVSSLLERRRAVQRAREQQLRSDRARLVLEETKKKLGMHVPPEAEESLYCIVCSEFIKDVVTLPCRHVSCCADCFQNPHMKAACMMCKVPITGTANVLPV